MCTIFSYDVIALRGVLNAAKFIPHKESHGKKTQNLLSIRCSNRCSIRSYNTILFSAKLSADKWKVSDIEQQNTQVIIMLFAVKDHAYKLVIGNSAFVVIKL